MVKIFVNGYFIHSEKMKKKKNKLKCMESASLDSTLPTVERLELIFKVIGYTPLC